MNLSVDLAFCDTYADRLSAPQHFRSGFENTRSAHPSITTAFCLPTEEWERKSAWQNKELFKIIDYIRLIEHKLK
jgi:hypothetical protein